MSDTVFRDLLLRMIDGLLAGEWDFDTFRRQYYDFYLERVPHEALTGTDFEVFDAAQEKLDWTAADPDPESRGYGWMDEGGYVDWLRKQRAALPAVPE